MDDPVSTPIEITLNGHRESIAERTTLSQLIAQFDEGDMHLIVEQNGRFVYPQDYDTTIVCHGDRIEFINPNFGG
jgi:thiamine biosynthesis protein ThiS